MKVTISTRWASYQSNHFYLDKIENVEARETDAVSNVLSEYVNKWKNKQDNLKEELRDYYFKFEACCVNNQPVSMEVKA